MKKLIAFFIFIAFAFGVYRFVIVPKEALPSFTYYDEFDQLDKDFWYVGEWSTYFSAYDKVKLNNSIIKLEVDEVDKGPVLMSKPIPIEKGNILTVKRRVKMKAGSNHFTGGLAFLDTPDSGLLPSVLNNSKSTLGITLLLLEYVYTPNDITNRPGLDNIRVLPSTWYKNNNYALADSIFNRWFEEEIIINTKTNEITYKVDGSTYEVKGQTLTNDHIRLFMHGYGFHTGHTVEIDWLDIKVE